MGGANTKCAHCKEHGDKCQKTCNLCESEAKCSCKCNVGKIHDIAQKATTITAGVGLTAGGITIIVITGGLAAPLVGAVAAGIGASLATSGISAIFRKKKLNAVELGIDTSIGAAAGLLTGGAGAFAGAATAVAETAIQVTVETVAVATSGAASAAMFEGGGAAKKVLRGEEPTFNPHAIWVGAATGAIGSAASGATEALASVVAERVAEAAGKTAVRVAIVGAGGTASGLANSAIVEGANVLRGREFNPINLAIGAATGAISGTSKGIGRRGPQIAGQTAASIAGSAFQAKRRTALQLSVDESEEDTDSKHPRLRRQTSILSVQVDDNGIDLAPKSGVQYFVLQESDEKVEAAEDSKLPNVVWYIEPVDLSDQDIQTLQLQEASWQIEVEPVEEEEEIISQTNIKDTKSAFKQNEIEVNEIHLEEAPPSVAEDSETIPLQTVTELGAVPTSGIKTKKLHTMLPRKWSLKFKRLGSN